MIINCTGTTFVKDFLQLAISVKNACKQMPLKSNPFKIELLNN